jgi:hypothetical protein
MKKIYVKPTAEIYNVELQGVIANNSITVSDEAAQENYEYGGDANQRRWGSLW